MDERDKKPLPDYQEIRSGDTLYKVTSIFAKKGDFKTLWEELIITKSMCLSDCERV